MSNKSLTNDNINIEFFSNVALNFNVCFTCYTNRPSEILREMLPLTKITIQKTQANEQLKKSSEKILSVQCDICKNIISEVNIYNNFHVQSVTNSKSNSSGSTEQFIDNIEFVEDSIQTVIK